MWCDWALMPGVNQRVLRFKSCLIWMVKFLWKSTSWRYSCSERVPLGSEMIWYLSRRKYYMSICLKKFVTGNALKNNTTQITKKVIIMEIYVAFSLKISNNKGISVVDPIISRKQVWLEWTWYFVYNSVEVNNFFVQDCPETWHVSSELRKENIRHRGEVKYLKTPSWTRQKPKHAAN